MTLEEFNNMPFQKKREIMIFWWQRGIIGFDDYALQRFEDLLSLDIDRVINFILMNQLSARLDLIMLAQDRNSSYEDMLDLMPSNESIPQNILSTFNFLKMQFINELINVSGIDLSNGRK